METNTCIYSSHLPLEKFCNTVNSKTSCVEVWDYLTNDRYTIKKEDFEKYWELYKNHDFLKPFFYFS